MQDNNDCFIEFQLINGRIHYAKIKEICNFGTADHDGIDEIVTCIYLLHGNELYTTENPTSIFDRIETIQKNGYDVPITSMN